MKHLLPFSKIVILVARLVTNDYCEYTTKVIDYWWLDNTVRQEILTKEKFDESFVSSIFNSSNFY